MAMTARGAVLPAVIATVAGLVVWAVLFVGVGRATEDVCLDDLAGRPHTSYSQDADLVPPRFTCALDASDPAVAPVVVHHPFMAWGRSLATLGFPVAWAVATSALLRRRARRA